jgi:prepilin-type N-terminal cleavage/methylation domain-containing protein
MGNEAKHTSHFMQFWIILPSSQAHTGDWIDRNRDKLNNCGANRSNESGFSLLELAIVLVILGAIGGLSIPLLTAHMTRSALLKTRTNQAYVLNAIAIYVEKNKRFPCPAEPHIIGANFGLALDTCRMEKAKGIIPFKTLGISETYARDGFKRLMTYVVEPELAKKQIRPQEESGGLITIKNEEGFSVLPTLKKTEKNQNYIAFVILSHGESGVGAYMGNGHIDKFTGHSLSLHKRENCDENFIFIESSQSDDILRWETRDQFLKHYVVF